MRRSKTLKIARHPADVTMYRVVQGGRILCDNLKTLDEALFWQADYVWLEGILGINFFKTPNE